MWNLSRAETKAPKEPTLDELLAAGQIFGKVVMGLTFDTHGAEIQMERQYVEGDFVHIRSTKYTTIKENLQACIHRARELRNFYRTL